LKLEPSESLIYIIFLAKVNSILWKIKEDDRLREAAKLEGLNGR